MIRARVRAPGAPAGRALRAGLVGARWLPVHDSATVACRSTDPPPGDPSWRFRCLAGNGRERGRGHGADAAGERPPWDASRRFHRLGDNGRVPSAAP